MKWQFFLIFLGSNFLTMFKLKPPPNGRYFVKPVCTVLKASPKFLDKRWTISTRGLGQKQSAYVIFAFEIFWPRRLLDYKVYKIRRLEDITTENMIWKHNQLLTKCDKLVWPNLPACRVWSLNQIHGLAYSTFICSLNQSLNDVILHIFCPLIIRLVWQIFINKQSIKIAQAVIAYTTHAICFKEIRTYCMSSCRVWVRFVGRHLSSI